MIFNTAFNISFDSIFNICLQFVVDWHSSNIQDKIRLYI